MRVSSSQLSQLVLQGLQRQGKDYAQLMNQMSSGFRITKISDDPLGTITLLGISREHSSLKQYQTNIQNVISGLEQTETYLNTSLDVLLRIQDLALTASNDTASKADRKAITTELKSLRDTLVSFANAKDDEGNYMFSGSRLDTPPIADAGGGFAYQGDNLRREVPVAQGVTIAANETIENVYFHNGDSFFARLDALINDMESGSENLKETGPALLDSLQRTIDGIGQKITEVGSRIVSARSLNDAQEDLALASEKIRGSIRDLDYIDAISKVNKIELALTTTQKTYTKLSQLSLFDYL